jgi:hypothetical protein
MLVSLLAHRVMSSVPTARQATTPKKRKLETRRQMEVAHPPFPTILTANPNAQGV